MPQIVLTRYFKG